MSKQPLTNTNPAIVVIGPNLEAIDFALQQYNFPSDPLDITPTLTVHKITSAHGLMTFITDEHPDPDLPVVFVADMPTNMRADVNMYFGPPVTMADALKMVNNEYAIRRDQIQNGTVKQTPKRRDY